MLFPLLKLPPMTPRDAIVLGAGPSLMDYSAREIQRSGAVLYGAGETSRLVTLDFYALGDVVHLISIPEPPTRTYAVPHIIRDARALKFNVPLLEFPQDRLPHGGSSGGMALSLACDAHHDRIFVLGFDGLSDLDGQLRRKGHATFFRGGWTYATPPESWEIELSQLRHMRQLEVGYPVTEFFSLMPNSTAPWRLHPFVAEQQWSRIDRHSRLTICRCLPQRLTECLALVMRWRQAHPRQAIVVVCESEIPVGEEEPPVETFDILLRREYPTVAERSEFECVDEISLP